jgi:hypothetical protein
MATPTRITELVETDPQGPDQLVIARGEGEVAKNYKIKLQDVTDPIYEKIDSLTINNESFDVIDSDTVDLEWNKETRKLTAHVQPDQIVPVGSVSMFPCVRPPDGWLLLEGQEIQKAEFPKLWAFAQQSENLVDEGLWQASRRGSFSYGASNNPESPLFRLPDLRSLFVRGSDTRADILLGGYQLDAFQGHKHGIYDPTHKHEIDDPEHSHAGEAGPAGKHKHKYEFWNDNQGSVEFGEVQNDGDIETKNTSEEPDHVHPLNIETSPTGIKIIEDSTGVLVQNPTSDATDVGSGVGNSRGLAPRTSFETRPMNVALNFCIKY